MKQHNDQIFSIGAYLQTITFKRSLSYDNVLTTAILLE